MAKNAIAKKWVLTLGEENRRYSDAPLDLVPPTAPVIAATSPGVTEMHLQVIVPSVDARHFVATYTFEYRTDAEKAAAAPFTVRQPVGAIVGTSGFTLTNLVANTKYWFRAKATDSSPSANEGAYSAEVSATTLPSTVAPADYWANWPFMNTCNVQGVVSDNLLDPAQHQFMADNDVHMFQSFYPTTARLTSRVSNINLVHAINPNLKFFLYTNFNQTIKSQTLSQQSALEVNRDFILDAVEGNPNWYLHRDEPNQAQVLEPNFDPPSNRQANPSRGAGLNSLGETYGEVFFRKWEELLNTGVTATNIKPLLAGQFADNYNARVPNVWVNNGASQVFDYDMDDDGAPDPRTDFSSGPNAGSRKWAEGHLDAKAAFEAEFPGQTLMVNSAQYDTDYLDGLGTPPLPIANHPHFKKLELMLAESRHLMLGLNHSATAYNIRPGSLGRLYRGLEIQKLMLKDDPNPLTGRGAVIMHTNSVNRTPNQDDHEYMRLWVGLSMLVERVANGVSYGASHCPPNDERLYLIGNPLVQRSMGTLNQSTTSFTLRAPNQTVGVAQFWWAEFENGIVILRGDYPPGPYPTVWPAGTAVSVTLPSPGAGRHWAMLPTSYTNPNTGRSFRNLSPTINNGATVTSVSMRPMTVRILRRV